MSERFDCSGFNQLTALLAVLVYHVIDVSVVYRSTVQNSCFMTHCHQFVQSQGFVAYDIVKMFLIFFESVEEASLYATEAANGSAATKEFASRLLSKFF